MHPAPVGPFPVVPMTVVKPGTVFMHPHTLVSPLPGRCQRPHTPPPTHTHTPTQHKTGRLHPGDPCTNTRCCHNGSEECGHRKSIRIPNLVNPRTAAQNSSSSCVCTQPFLPNPPGCDGSLPGDFGFDPLGLSSVRIVGLPLNKK